MYLFTRRTRLAPTHQLDGVEWAAAIVEKVNQVTALELGVWTPQMSPGVGTLSYGCTAETLTDLENAEAKLLADSIYLDLAAKGAEMTNGQLDDMVAQYVVGGGDPGFEPSYVAVVQSQLANGRLQRGIAAGIAIAQKATEIGGLPTAFLAGATGSYGGIAWLTPAPTLADLERTEQAVNGNPEFLGLVDESSECYLEGVTTQEIWRRIV
jgi:hypothetical protein